MEQKCRLCLEYCKTVDTTTIMDEDFREKMTTVFTFPIEIDETDLPVTVCGKCMLLIDDFHAFSVQVCANQKQLMLHSKENATNELFEVVKVESNCKEELFETETEDYHTEPTMTKSNSVPKNESFTENHNADVEASNMEESRPESAEKLVTRSRRKKVIDSQRVTVTSEEQNRRRDDEDKQIREHYKMDCEVCSTSLSTFADLQVHFRNVHNTTGYIRCCDKVLSRRGQLMEHISVHKGALRCDVCQKVYKCGRSLSMHKLKNHSRAEDRPFKCDKCHQSYPKQHLLTAHLVRHMQEQCPVCGKTLSCRQALKVHVAQMHGEDSNRICATCGKEYRTKRAMDRHIKEHLGMELTERVQCHVCDKWISGKYNLKKHIRFIHIEQGQEFQCDICHQKYPNTRALIYHKQRVHVEEMFKCEYCGKRFKRKIYLKEHIATHTMQPLYSCDLCDGTFKASGNLYAHRRSMHAAERLSNKQIQPFGTQTTV